MKNIFPRIVVILAFIALVIPVAFVASSKVNSDNISTPKAVSVEKTGSEVRPAPSEPTDDPLIPFIPNETSSEEESNPIEGESNSTPKNNTTPNNPTNNIPGANQTTPPAGTPTEPPKVVPPTPKPVAPPLTTPPEPQPPACPNTVSGSISGAPSRVSEGGVAGTTTDDLISFANKYNEIRIANCLPPISLSNFRYDSCMETRLFWMAEDPSTDPMSAWGHIGSVRSDGVPSVGCDGNLAGGSGNTGATVAQKWWDSTSHRSSLYRPTTTNISGVCIYFAMTHGGIPNEPYSFTRAAARWGGC